MGDFLLIWNYIPVWIFHGTVFWKIHLTFIIILHVLTFPPFLSEDDIPEASSVKCTGRFEGTGVDDVDVVETVSLWDSSFFVVACSLFFSFFLMPMDSKQIHTCLKQSKLS